MIRLLAFGILFLRNWLSRAAVVDPASGVVVTLTSHAGRVRKVFAAIESIGRGLKRPARIILYLGHTYEKQTLPESLQRLVSRGLEIIYCDDVGPHTKFFPYLLSQSSLDMPLVTADDDKLYDKYWLATLEAKWRREPELIHCFRAREIRLNRNGIAPYWDWPLCTSDQPSILHFATGVSGVIYPPSFQKLLKQEGNLFLELCPKADDIWLHVMALRHGYRIRQVSAKSLEYPGIPGASQYALRRINVDDLGNDEQIKKTYLPDDIRHLRAIAEHN